MQHQKFRELPASSKWLSLLGACLCTTPAGIVYAFSLYGPQLALKLGYTSIQINFIAASGSLGVYVTTPLFGHFADTRPPTRLAWIAACLFFIGFYAIALTYEGSLAYGHYLVIAIYYLLVGMACACSNIVALSTTGHNFKEERGIGIGVPVTMFGLSASIFSCIYRLFFVHQGVPDIPRFLRFLALATSASTFLGSFLLVKIGQPKDSDNSHCYDDIPLDEISDESVRPEEKSSHSSLVELSGQELFLNFDARLLFMTISFIGGSGLMFINNIGSVLRALYEVGEVGNLPALQSSCVTILSLFNCGGRLVFALTSDRAALSKRRVRRSSYLLASAILAFLAHLSIAFSPASLIVMCSAAQGLGYGMMYAASTTITSMWFGTKNYGTNWGWMATGPGICGQVMSFIFGALYDSNVVKSASEEHVCASGVKCYSFAFQVAALLCLLAIVVTYVLRSHRVKLHP